MPLTNKIESMKKKMIISFIVVATVMSFIGSSYSNNNTNDLLLDNIEALANGEQENGITCIGEGTVDCPIGIKVRAQEINPREWLNDVIAKLPFYLERDSGKNVRELLPDVWKLEKSNTNPIGV